MNAQSRNTWACGLLPVLFAALVLLLWGVSAWTLTLAIIALACPLAMLWSWRMARRALAPLDEPVPHTRGMTMDWAVPVYDWYCPRLGLGPAFRRETLRHAALRPGEHVLDAGCGTGVLTRLAAEAVGATGRVVGIDPGPRMLAMARRNASACGARVEFRLAAIEALPFPDASFDAVLASLMLHHLPPGVKLAGLKEVYRVLKPGGRLIAVDLDRPAHPLWWLAAWPLLLMPMTRGNVLGEITALLRTAGFDPVAARARWLRLLTFWEARKPHSVNMHT